MGSYTVIEETGDAIVKLLREQLVPEFVEHQENIDLCSPDDKGDLCVGVHLYDIRQSEEMLGIGARDIGLSKQAYPSLFLNLYYMITVYSESDVKYRARQEQKLLGRILQIFYENQLFPEDKLMEGSKSLNYPVKIELEKLSLEDKMKIYSVPGKGYKCSLFYRVYPIELESTRIKKVRRVTDMDLHVKEDKERSRI